MPVIGSPEDRSPKRSATAPRPDCSNTGCAWINVGTQTQDNAHPWPAFIKHLKCPGPQRLIKMPNGATQRSSFECFPCYTGNDLFASDLQYLMRGSWLYMTRFLRLWRMVVRGSQLSVTYGKGGGWEPDKDGWLQLKRCNSEQQGLQREGKRFQNSGHWLRPGLYGAEGELV